MVLLGRCRDIPCSFSLYLGSTREVLARYAVASSTTRRNSTGTPGPRIPAPSRTRSARQVTPVEVRAGHDALNHHVLFLGWRNADFKNVANFAARFGTTFHRRGPQNTRAAASSRTTVGDDLTINGQLSATNLPSLSSPNQKVQVGPVGGQPRPGGKEHNNRNFSASEVCRVLLMNWPGGQPQRHEEDLASRRSPPRQHPARGAAGGSAHNCPR